MRHLAASTQISRIAEVLVTSNPWPDLVRSISAQPPDLLVLDWEAHFDYLAISPGDVLLSPPCNVALVRGPFPGAVNNVLLPIRGGPHAELVLSVGISLAAPHLSALHLRPPELPPGGDAPFIGLQQVLRQMPEIGSKTVVTGDSAGAILAEAKNHDLIVMGATAQPLDRPTTLGPVADEIIRHADAAVIVVKNKRTMPWPQADEAVGVQAISILVDRWFAENTFHADEFANLRELIAAKHAQGLTVSLALPALNEEATIGTIISAVKQALMERDAAAGRDRPGRLRLQRPHARDRGGAGCAGLHPPGAAAGARGAARQGRGAVEEPPRDARRHHRLDRHRHR